MVLNATWYLDVFNLKSVYDLLIVWYYSVECLANTGLQADSSVCEEDLDFMEQINQELELDSSAGSQPEGLIKRSANLFCNERTYFTLWFASHL